MLSSNDSPQCARGRPRDVKYGSRDVLNEVKVVSRTFTPRPYGRLKKRSKWVWKDVQNRRLFWTTFWFHVGRRVDVFSSQDVPERSCAHWVRWKALNICQNILIRIWQWRGITAGSTFSQERRTFFPGKMCSPHEIRQISREYFFLREIYLFPGEKSTPEYFFQGSTFWRLHRYW